MQVASKSKKQDHFILNLPGHIPALHGLLSVVCPWHCPLRQVLDLDLNPDPHVTVHAPNPDH